MNNHFIKKVINGGGDVRTTQQWAILKLENFNYDDVKSNKVHKMYDFFDNVIRKHTSLIYPELINLETKSL